MQQGKVLSQGHYQKKGLCDAGAEIGPTSGDALDMRALPNVMHVLKIQVYTLENERRSGKKWEIPPKRWKGPLENGKSLTKQWMSDSALEFTVKISAVH